MECLQSYVSLQLGEGLRLRGSYEGLGFRSEQVKQVAADRHSVF